MDIETVLMQYKNVIHYEVSRVLYEQIDLWDEAIQETFIRINASLPSIVEKDGKYQENYVRVIARNAARTILSKKNIYLARNLSLEEWSENHEDCYSSYEQSFFEGNVCPEMESCLNQLEPAERDILFLREIEGLQYDEIAKAFGITKDACRKRISRAKKNLKMILTDTGEGKQVIRGRVRHNYEER